MVQLHPATQLMIYACLLLIVGMPIIAWFVQPRPVSLQSRLWHLGLAFIAIGALGLAIMGRSSWFPPSALTVSIFLCIEAMRCDLEQRRVHWFFIIIASALYLSIQLVYELTGLRMTWGIIFTSFSLMALALWLAIWVRRVSARLQSRGLQIVVVGLVVFMLSNLARGVDALTRLQADPIFSFAPMANATVIGVTLFSVLMTFGYVAFALEKLHAQRLLDAQNTARAEEKTRLARLHADELQQLVQERDAMIMLNSRFSAVNSLAIFNSAIAHEISQPIQGLQSIVDKLYIKTQDRAPSLMPDVDAIVKMLSKVSEVLAALRGLISAQSPGQELVSVDDVLRDVLPIMKSEAKRRKIEFDYACQNAPHALRVQVNRVLLERVLLNLVANALEALTLAKTAHPRIRVHVEPAAIEGKSFVVLRVEDNGPGFPHDVLPLGKMSLVTTKSGGSGIGLALASINVESWRGSLRLANRNAPGQSGAVVELTLPVHE